MKRARRCAMLLLLLLGGCDTTIQIQNDLVGVELENVRWVSRSGESYAVQEALASGERSDEITLSGDEDEGAAGHIEFEMVASGSRVFLVTESEFTPSRNDSVTFRIEAQTRVHNPSLTAEH